MGYPPFNLTTLQLVAPSANMTKAEYKDAYGIDLDDVNIKAFKLVLFGGEKYTIDQIKEVEDGIEIYFGGRILSITDIVQVSNEVYDVANATPIYVHPISFDIKVGGTSIGRATCLIMGNRATKFANFDDLISFIRSWGLEYALILTNGGVYDNSKDVVLSVMSISQDRVYLYGYSVTDHAISGSIAIDSSNVENFEDQVNKIN